MPNNYTPSLDLPMELQELLSMPPATGMPAGAANYADGGMVGAGGQPVMYSPNTNPFMSPLATSSMGAGGIANYAEGGMVGPDGMPAPMGMPLGATPEGPPNIGMADVEGFIRQNPQAVQQIAMELQQLVAAGELSPQQLQMGQQLAETALNDPETYPQLRQFAIQQGLVGPEDIPEEYDQAVLFSIIVAARAVMEGGAGGQMGMQPEMGMQQGMMNMKDGGYIGPGSNAAMGGKVVGPGTSRSDSIPINVSTGEYVIPAHVVQMKGKEFFDKMLESYKPGGSKK